MDDVLGTLWTSPAQEELKFPAILCRIGFGDLESKLNGGHPGVYQERAEFLVKIWVLLGMLGGRSGDALDVTGAGGEA